MTEKKQNDRKKNRMTEKIQITGKKQEKKQEKKS
jgi:hypothetical protein